MDSHRLHITNVTNQVGLRLVGFMFVMIFVVLIIRWSALFIFPFLGSLSFLFIKTGYFLDFKYGEVEQYISIFSWKRSKLNVLNSSYALLVHKVTYRRPILQTLHLRFRHERYISTKFRVTIVSEDDDVYIELPLMKDYSKMRSIVDQLQECTGVDVYTNF